MESRSKLAGRKWSLFDQFKLLFNSDARRRFHAERQAIALLKKLRKLSNRIQDDLASCRSEERMRQLQRDLYWIREQRKKSIRQLRHLQMG